MWFFLDIMLLIRKLDIRKSKTGNSCQSWGLFWCPFCERGVEKNLGHGKTAKSCGCVQHAENKTNYKHGEKGTRLYSVWRAMKKRCLNPNNKNYKNYGGRGINVCNEWLDKNNGYINFRDWALNNGYKEGLQIDRINNNGDYELNNCRFVTSQINNQNRRTAKLSLEKADEIVELYNTDKYTIKELAEKYNVASNTIYRIINNKSWCN